jgi:hypothetical protein
MIEADAIIAKESRFRDPVRSQRTHVGTHLSLKQQDMHDRSKYIRSICRDLIIHRYIRETICFLELDLIILHASLSFLRRHQRTCASFPFEQVKLYQRPIRNIWQNMDEIRMYLFSVQVLLAGAIGPFSWSQIVTVLRDGLDCIACG